ncbi:MAG: LOW QUALITY PROTEIN: hypothetical protein J3Q66DRAFT_375858 [Benniella sp.]|nr:MAG: LOW QUALITY PROTEIN: hypothetical protein J3Q66DRAFT_375858 [Benniella sp.]
MIFIKSSGGCYAPRTPHIGARGVAALTKVLRHRYLQGGAEDTDDPLPGSRDESREYELEMSSADMQASPCASSFCRDGVMAVVDMSRLMALLDDRREIIGNGKLIEFLPLLYLLRCVYRAGRIQGRVLSAGHLLIVNVYDVYGCN